MDPHYYHISLVPHGVLSCWFFILGQQIEWRMLSSLFVFPGVPHDRVRAMYRAQGERWDQRKDHSVWIEARFISATSFTCWCLHYTVSIPKEMGHHPALAYSMCITEQCLTINSHCSSSTWVQPQTPARSVSTWKLQWKYVMDTLESSPVI